MKIVLLLLGAYLFALAYLLGGGWLAAGWLGADFVALGIAHAGGFHGLYRKRPDGTIPAVTWVLFLPLMLLSWSIWFLMKTLTREPAFNTVNDSLVVGRRLSASERVEACDQYLDLTAEFMEPRPFRAHPGYLSFPILDGSAPAPSVLHALVRTLDMRKTYVHCAAGHGRAGLVSLALLLYRQQASSIEEGLALLKTARPRIWLNATQRACIDEFSRLLT